MLGLDVSLQNGVLHVVEHTESAPAAASESPDWFGQALALESSDAQAALERLCPCGRGGAAERSGLEQLGAPAARGRPHAGSRRCLPRALERAGADSLLLYNQGVLLEDLGDAGAAVRAYQSALEEDPDFADCHYNLARLYESLGKAQHAIRHLGQYRRLVSNESR